MSDYRSIGLLLACAAVASGFQAKKPRPAIEQQMMVLRVPVPDLSGLTPDQATETLRAAHLRPGNQSFTISTKAPGTVVAQDPLRDTMVSAGSAVNLVLAQRENLSRVMVPDLRTLSVDDARIRLRRAELRLGEVLERPSPDPPGTVVDQSPPPQSQAPPGASVQVWIATPVQNEEVEVPDLTGLTLTQAADRLQQAELAAGQQMERESGAEPGTIVDQDPKPGVRMAKASAVNLSVATGAPVEVPDVRGLRAALAAAELKRAGLRVGEETRLRSAQPATTVLTQSPPPGARARRGLAVSLEIATGTPLAPKPASWPVAPVTIVSGAVLAAAAVLLATRFKRKPDHKTRREQPVRLHPRPEPGTQALSRQDLVRKEAVVRLVPRPDSGGQTLTIGPLAGKGKESL